MHHSHLRLLLIALGAALLPGTASARPLDIESCDRLLQQEAALEQAGVRAHFNKGPAWAKTNLSADKIEQVRQLIELDETIAFRCRNPKPLPPGSVNAQPAPPVAAAAVPVKPRPKPKPVSAAADGAGDATPVAAPKPKPKPVAKAVKPADAFTASPAKAE